MLINQDVQIPEKIQCPKYLGWLDYDKTLATQEFKAAGLCALAQLLKRPESDTTRQSILRGITLLDGLLEEAVKRRRHEIAIHNAALAGNCVWPTVCPLVDELLNQYNWVRSQESAGE